MKIEKLISSLQDAHKRGYTDVMINSWEGGPDDVEERELELLEMEGETLILQTVESENETVEGPTARYFLDPDQSHVLDTGIG